MKVALLLAVVFAVLASAADDAVATKENAESIATVHGHLDGLVFKPLFPEHPDLRFVAGDVGELCLGFVNNLDRFINVTHVDASLRALHDDHDVIQNLTRQFYGINTPGKGTSVAIDFQFKPDAMLDATAYVLVVEVAYRDGENNHTEVVFNRTVTVVEPEQRFFNPETAFLVLLLLAGFGGAFYFGGAWASKKISGATKGRPAANSPAAKIVRDSFLEGTTASANKAKSPKKSPKNN